MTQLDENLRRQLIHDEGRVVDLVTLPAPEHVAYQDSEGYWTIGYGFNLDDKAAVESLALVTTKQKEHLIARTERLTESEAQQLLTLRIKIATNDASDLLGDFDALSDPRKLAVISMSFQLGKKKFSGFKDTIAALNSAEYERAAQEIKKSRWAAQAKRRVQALSMAVGSDAYPATALPPPQPVVVSPPAAAPSPAAQAKPPPDGPPQMGTGIDKTEARGEKQSGGDGGGPVHQGGTITIDIHSLGK